MHGLQACLFKYITVAAFHIYPERHEDAAKRGGRKEAMHLIVMEIILLIMENYGIVFLNFCGNPAGYIAHENIFSKRKEDL